MPPPSPAVLDVDLERSWIESLNENLRDLPIDNPSRLFRVKGKRRWIEPRILSIEPTEGSLRQAWDVVVLQIRCFVVVEAKGEPQRHGRELGWVLSEVVDEVRRVIDPRRTVRGYVAGVLRIRDCDGQEVGILQCSPASERRAYNQSVRIRGDQVPGLDVATLTVPCRLTSNICG